MSKNPLLKLLSIVGIVTVLFAFSGCKKGGEDETETSDANNGSEVSENNEDVIYVSHSLWPPDKIAYLAEELDLYTEKGANVETIWIDGYDELFELIDSGEVDVWSMTLLDLVIGRASGEDWQAILMQDSSAGADGIVVHPDSGIENVADLAGKKVGVEDGTVSQFFLAALLEKEGLTLDDLEIVAVGAEYVPEALMVEKTIDAGVTYESMLSEVVGDGADLLVDSSKERGLIVDVWVAHEADIEENAEEYAKVLSAIIEAGEYLNENPQEAAEIMHEALQLSVEDTVATFDKLRIPDLQENITVFDRTSGFQSLHTLTRQAVEFLFETGSIDEQLDADEILNSSIIELIQQ